MLEWLNKDFMGTLIKKDSLVYLLGRAFSVSLLVAFLLMISVAFFTINIVNLNE